MTEASINPALIPATPYVPLTIYPLTNNSESRTPVGYRLAEVAWRQTEEQKAKGRAKRSPICVAVPLISLSVQPECFATELQELFEDAQDSAIAVWVNKEIESNTNYNPNLKIIPVELTTPTGLAEVFSDARAKMRLSKESISAWFDSHLLEFVVTKVYEKRPDAPDTEINAIAERYKSAITNLASPRAMLDVASATTLSRIVAEASDGKIRRALSEKLNGFINPKPSVTLEDLI